MARPLRLEHEYALWHVTSRGNERKDIFRDDVDRERFLQILAETVLRFGWRLLSWVLMSNHYHLVIQTPEANLSRGMHWLNARYAQGFNRRHERIGHLFQGRFKGILVDKQSYLQELARYVVLNPVRAGLVDHPAEWRWSSYRETAGLVPCRPWLAADDLREHFGLAPGAAREEYIRFVDAGVRATGSPWTDLVGQIFLGTGEWIDVIASRIASAAVSSEHPRQQCTVGRPDRSDVLDAVASTFDMPADCLRTSEVGVRLAREVCAYLCFEDALVRQTEIATFLGLEGRSTASSMIRRLRSKAQSSMEIAGLVDACRSRMRRRPPPPALVPPHQAAFYDEMRCFGRP